MKRLSIVLAAIGLSAGAFAALPAATDPTLVAVPQLPGGFFIGGSLYYLQASPTNGDLDYASVNIGTTSAFSSEIHDVEPGYDWGWGVNVGYIFPNTGNDVNLSYFQLDTDDTNSVTILNTTLASIDPFGFDNASTSSFNNFADAKAEYDINQVDLTAGQFIDVGCRLILHPMVGLRYASLDRTLDSNYSNLVVSTAGTTTTTDLAHTHEDSDFSGIGPLAGIDASYYIGMGFGAVAHVDSALLVGNIDSKTNAEWTHSVITTSTVNTFAFTDLNDNSNRRIVPVVDMKLGADYTYLFNNEQNSDLTLEVGYQVSNYFNAVDRVRGTIAAAGASGIPSTIVSHTTSDVGLDGPYATLTFHA